MSKYGVCPCCGSNMPIYSGAEGTNSFIAVDVSTLESERDRYRKALEEIALALKGIEWTVMDSVEDFRLKLSTRLLEVFDIRRREGRETER